MASSVQPLRRLLDGNDIKLSSWSDFASGNDGTACVGIS